MVSKVALGGLISGVIIITIVGGYWWIIKADFDDRTARGCRPAAWNMLGVTTIWSCPVGPGPEGLALTAEEKQIQQQEQEQEQQRAYEEENQRRKEAGFRQTDNSVIVKLLGEGCQTVTRNSFNQTIVWNCPNGTVTTP